MNSYICVGRLTKEPELRYIASTGTAVTRFSIAVDRPFAKKDAEVTADFFNVVVWGKTAEHCVNYLAKGRQVALRGRLQNNNYTDKDGVKRYSVEIKAEEVKFIDWGDKKGQGNQSNDSFDDIDDAGYKAINDQDIPF
jgi:single-stranded DNA-binding protein